ncbi:MAG TPA: hypothetical protein VM536_17995, partial [Chloroflexia bacterium]|nr:hypothetical protein [Chloroflexia bacterium]
MKTRRPLAESNSPERVHMRAGVGVGHAVREARVSSLAPASGHPLWPRTVVRTDVGRVRDENEDAVFALTALLPGGTAGLPFGFF